MLGGLGVTVAAPARAADAPRHDITIDARGPLALVEVTRALPAPDRPGASEAMLDLALPAQSVLVAVEVRDRGRWRSIEAAAAAAPADAYRNESATRPRQNHDAGVVLWVPAPTRLG